MASIIPPKKPRKPGMPKLSIPSRPSSSPANPNQPSERSSSADRPGIAGNEPSQRQPPSLLIPQASSSSISLNNPYDDGYEEGNVGFNTTASSIYPDTVPHLTNAHDHNALTDDLRRAIGGLSVNDEERTDSGGLRIPAVGGRKASTGFSDRGAANAASSRSAASGSSDTTTSKDGATTGSSRTAAKEDEDLVLQGNLEILSKLGEGASGEVKKARHTPTGLLMAKKVSRACCSPYMVV